MGYVVDSKNSVPNMKDVSIVCEFTYVVPEKLPGLPLNVKLILSLSLYKLYAKFLKCEFWICVSTEEDRDNCR